MIGSTQDKIRNYLIQKGRGVFIFLQDFALYGNNDAVKKAFQRLSNEGIILRIAKGIYYYPKTDTQLGIGVLHPSIDEVAQAIAERDKTTIIPTGSYALNMLGLSTQVVTNAVYLTNGSPRRIKVGSGKGILFLHTSNNKMLSFHSRLMLLIVSAMREIGDGKITESEINIIKKHLTHVTEDDFQHDISLAPIWVRNILLKK